MAEKKLNVQNAIAVACAGILVGTEILAAALALGWALGGLTGWGKEVTYGLVGVCLLAGLWLIAAFLRKAAKAEPIYE